MICLSNDQWQEFLRRIDKLTAAADKLSKINMDLQSRILMIERDIGDLKIKVNKSNGRK